MASWVENEPKIERKKWNLDDRTSLNNLKYHFAEDGCSDVQYDLARQLLESSETNPIGNHVQGVHWLLRAAQQGHHNSLVLLTECYKTRRGINDANECEVHSCISMSASERAARKAARELFACLSNGEEFITAAQLERRMREIYKLQKKKRKRCESSEEEEDEIGEENENCNATTSPVSNRTSRIDLSHSELLTEAHLVSAAVNYANGHLPIVSRELILSTPRPETLDHIPCFHRPIFHPIKFFSLFYHRFIKAIASFPGSKLSNFQLLILLFIYSMVASDNIIMFIPVITYYLSLITMIVSSFKMLKTKHEFIDFRIWSGLFLSYGDENINVENTEFRFLRNNMKPYLYFFLSFIVNIILHPIIADQWVPHSEITLISFILIFVTMFAFMYSSSPFPDYLILFSFGVNVLAKYPYEMDTVVTTGWRFLDLKVPTFSSFVIGNGIEFCLNCRGLLYLMIPGFLFYLAHRKDWRGTYQYLIPHCVTLSWLQICIVSSQCATMFGLVRATLGLAGLLLFLPLFGIVTLLIPVFAALEFIGSFTDPNIRFYVSIIAAIFAIIFSCIMALNERTEKYITFVQISICVIATIFLTLPYMTSNFDLSHSQPTIYESLVRHNQNHKTDNIHHNIHNDHDLHHHNLNWDIYYKYCHQPAWNNNINKIKTQLRCTHLDNTYIRWEGIVTDVEIVKIKNLRADIIKNYMPTFIGETIICYYGDKNNVDCDENENCDEIKTFINDQKKCNLNKWNSYEYEITVRMNSGLLTIPADIILKANDIFSNLTLRLHSSDRIWFKGILRNVNKINNNNGNDNGIRLGKTRPIIELLSIGCIKCNDIKIQTIRTSDSLRINARIRDLMRGVKYLLNVIFNPLLTFK